MGDYSCMSIASPLILQYDMRNHGRARCRAALTREMLSVELLWLGEGRWARGVSWRDAEEALVFEVSEGRGSDKFPNQ